jgi:hypothetical protein
MHDIEDAIGEDERSREIPSARGQLPRFTDLGFERGRHGKLVSETD